LVRQNKAGNHQIQARVKPAFCQGLTRVALAQLRTSDLTKEQRAAIESTFGPTLDYLNRLQ
jgi:hypothetical protein